MSPASSSSDETMVDKRPSERSGRSVATTAVSGFVSLVLWATQAVYYAYQYAVRWLFSSPYSPPAPGTKALGRIAVVGAGLTGISSAAHAVAHGFEVVIYEAEDSVGGVWSRVNSTSSLQLNSILYRFHPTVIWSCGFPQRDEIVGQIEALWHRYHLESATRLSTPARKVTRHALSTDPKDGGHARWVINDGEDGIFDAVLVTIGSCGPAKKASFPNQDAFRGPVVHSSGLDDAELADRKVVIVGSGASGVEAAELAILKGAKDVVLLARSDKWIIPRDTLFDIALSLQPFGKEMPLSFIPEWLLRTFFYQDQMDLAPTPADKGLFEGTPIVNDAFLQHVRDGKVRYVRGDTQEFTSKGLKFNERERGTKAGDDGQEKEETADVVIIATGFERPGLDWLPEDVFPQEGERSYKPPNLYLQTFSTADWSVLMTNAAYLNAIAVVGNWHIGIYLRVLLTFIIDERTRPTPKGMKLWVDLINWVKGGTFGSSGSLAFFTYLELLIWFATFHVFNLARLPWLPFVLFGWGTPVRRRGRAQNDGHETPREVKHS